MTSLQYQKSRAVAEQIFEASKRFPPEETDSLTSQLRRSSRFVGAQIAEAWGKRRYVKHFALDDREGSDLLRRDW